MNRIPRPLIVALALALPAATSCAALEDLPRLEPEQLRFRLAQSSKIFDSRGDVITTLHRGQDRTIVALRAIPKVLRDAVVAIEDERFYKHEGVDLKAVVRALVSNVTSGGIREGGSTITQQYVKNYIIAPDQVAERSLERKIDEAALSRQLEKRLSKDEILWRYLNTVYFGQGAYGVQAAAKTYFGKSVSALDLREAALLAGLIRSPETYDPFDQKRLALERRNLVLSKMEELGWASPVEVRRARASKLGLQRRVDKDSYPAPYFVDYVERLIQFDPRFKVFGDTAEKRRQALFTGGLKIHTTIDQRAQAAAEEAIDAILTQRSDPHGALVAVDPSSGHIVAMVGGRDWFAPRKKDPFAKLNLATLAEPNLDCQRRRKTLLCREPLKPDAAPGTGRQAGSAFKPFALAAAIESGASLSEVYEAGNCLSFPAVNWDRVCNYEESAFGKVSLLEATVNSINVVYAQLILAGEPVDKKDAPTLCKLCGRTVELANAAGVKTLDTDDPNMVVPSAVLGSNPVNALGMASAFATLATNGEYHPPVAITKIVGPGGKVFYEDRSRPDQVMDEGAAYLTTTALEQVIARGTGTAAQLGRPAAGKTGTAQEYRDAWFAGYTPALAAAVWVGYPEASLEMKTSCGGDPGCRPTRIQVTGGSWPAQIWGRFMRRVLAGVAARGFAKPAIDLVTVTIDTRDGCLADRFTPDEYRASATFLGGTEPEESCREEDRLLVVPDLFGFPLEDARRILTDGGFEVVVVRKETRTYQPGHVIGQDPQGGATAQQGSAVTLIVSARVAEPERGTVPSVLGLRQEEAEERIRGEGFEVRVIVESEGKDAKKRKGRVWKQDPAEGAEREYGATVTIWVNPE